MHLIKCIKKQGFTLIEILIVVALSGLIIPPLFVGFMTTRDGKAQQQQRIEALELLKETSEAMRSYRENDWTQFAVNGTYHPVISGNAWTLVSGSQTVNGFTKSVVISSVQRNATGDIVQTGGIDDPSTKKVDITIAWDEPSTGSVNSTQYITRHLDNGAYIDSTQAEFNNSTQNQVAVTSTAGGEVTLGTNTKAQWCEPQLSNATLDLPGQPNAVWATEGHVYVATGQTTSSSQDSFAHVLVANTDPPTSSIHGKLRGYKTNAVFGEPNWGYIATTNDSKEIVIVNLTQFSNVANKLYREEGSFNATGTADADTIFVHNNRGYMTAGQYLYVFNLSSRSGSRSQIGNRISFADSGDKANEIYVREVSGSIYVYVAVEGSTVDEIKIINVTNNNISSQWRVVGGLNIEPNNCSSLESGKAVFVKPDGTRAYISSVNDQNFKEFFTINTTNKSSPTLSGGFATNPPCTNGGGYEAGGMDPEQSTIVSLLENRAVLVGVDAEGGVDSEEYQVLDLSNEAVPIKCGGLQLNQGIYGVAGVKETDGDAYAYIITGDEANELKIVQGGPDGHYFDTGSIESHTFDLGYSSSFNRFTATTTKPVGTDIRFQFAGADPINGSCTGVTFNFTGPDGTNTSYYPSTGGTILTDNDNTGYENPARCFRYKAFLTSINPDTTPVLSDVTVNYSP